MDQILNELLKYWKHFLKVINWKSNHKIISTFYAQYNFQSKIAIILSIIIIFYLLGKRNRNVIIQNALKKLNNSDQFQIQLANNRMKTSHNIEVITKIIKYSIALNLLAILLTVLRFLNIYTFLQLDFYGMMLGCTIIVFLIVYIIKMFLLQRLRKQSKQINDIAKQTDKEVDKILTFFGNNLVNILKVKLQKNQIESRQTTNMQDCRLARCSQHIKLLKQAILYFQKIISQFTSHKWCQTCSALTEDKKIQEINLHIDLKNIKIKDMSLEQMKKKFNQLLDYYNKRIKILDSICKQECTKSFCQFLRPITQKFYEQYEKIEKNLNTFK